VHTLDRTHQIEAPLEEVFAFFSDPGNLARITPPWLRFRIHEAPVGPLTEGSRIEYRIRWAIFTLGWVTRITLWQPGVAFRDIQEKGPYRTWIHTHHFRKQGRLVEMHDHVEYELPLGILGRMAHGLRVRRQLEDIFDYRNRVIDELFSASRS
jgi:ligand-binding SRPBCC domain-containing protein